MALEHCRPTAYVLLCKVPNNLLRVGHLPHQSQKIWHQASGGIFDSPHNCSTQHIRFSLRPSTQALHLQGFFGDVYKAASAGRAALASVRQSYGRPNAFANIEAELRIFEHWSQLGQNDAATASNMVAVLAPFVKTSAIAGCGAYWRASLRRTQALLILM